MRTRFLVLTFGAVMAAWSSVASAQRAVFLVRHAERLDESEGSPLSRAGEARAQLLASLLKDAGITAIYITPGKSSGLFIKTAEPLALVLKMKPISFPNTNLEGLFKRIQAENRDDIVLIVGTGKSVPHC